MKNLIRTLILAPAVLCASAAFAAETSTLNVPFSFTANGKAYPAGNYTVSVDANHQIVTLSKRGLILEPVGGALAPSDGNPSGPATARLEFSTNGPDHELRRIKYGAFATSDLSSRKAGAADVSKGSSHSGAGN